MYPFYYKHVLLNNSHKQQPQALHEQDILQKHLQID